jgi:hypothetical protein
VGANSAVRGTRTTSNSLERTHWIAGLSGLLAGFASCVSGIARSLSLSLKSDLSLGLLGCLDHLAFRPSSDLGSGLFFPFQTGDPLRFLGSHASRMAIGSAGLAGRLYGNALRLPLQHGWVIGCWSCAELLHSSGLGA